MELSLTSRRKLEGIFVPLDMFGTIVGTYSDRALSIVYFYSSTFIIISFHRQLDRTILIMHYLILLHKVSHLVIPVITIALDEIH